MSLETANITAILGMAIATYATRIGGLWLMRAIKPGPILTHALDAMPVAVLTAVIAPTLAKGGAPDLIAGGITVLAAMRLSLLVTVALGVGSAIFLRSLLV